MRIDSLRPAVHDEVPDRHRRPTTTRRLTALLGTAALFAGMAVIAAPVANAATTRSVSKSGTDSGDCTVTACATMQYAIGVSNTGDTISVAAGTYDEAVTIDKSVTLLGAQAGVAPAGTPGGIAQRDGLHPGGESIVGDGANSVFTVTADNVTIDGFTIDGAVQKTAVVMDRGAASNSGESVTNNIVIVGDGDAPASTTGGITFNSSDTVVSNNRVVYPSTGHTFGIRFANNNGNQSGITISGNFFETDNGAALVDADINFIGGRSAPQSASMARISHIVVSGNSSDFPSKRPTVAFGHVDDLTLSDQIGGRITPLGSSYNVTISHNDFTQAAAPISILQYPIHAGTYLPNHHITVAHNKFNGSKPNVLTVTAGSVDDTVNAIENWWGKPAGPELSQISVAEPTKSVTYDPWCTNEECTTFSSQTVTVASPAHHPGWDYDPEPAGKTGSPDYVGDSGTGHSGVGALNLVGARAVNYFHIVNATGTDGLVPLNEINQLSLSVKDADASPRVTVQLRVVHASGSSSPIGFTSLLTTVPGDSAVTGWQNVKIDLLTAKFQSTAEISGLSAWASGKTLGEIATSNPNAKVYMYGVFRGSTDAPDPIAEDGTNDALIDDISFNLQRTDFEPESADPAHVTLTSTPSDTQGWEKDNAAPTYDGPAGASGTASLTFSTAAKGSPRDHVDYFHSVRSDALPYNVSQGAASPDRVSLVGVQDLGFKFYSAAGTVYPTYQLRIYGAIRTDGRTNTNEQEWTDGYTALNWEWTANKGTAPTQGQWISLDDLENGQWWATRSINGLPTPQSSTATLAQIAFANPGAVIVAYGINAGRNSTAATMYVDDVTFNGTTTDFEPNATNNNGNTGGNAGGNTGGNGTGGTPTGGIQVLGATDRISGSDRFATSALVADSFGTANAVVIANGSTAKNGADALAANYLAGRVNAPILLTEAGSVPATILASVKEVLDGSTSPTVYVMGKSDSVSDAAVAAIRSAASSVATGTVKVVRVAGNNRYETSADAAEAVGPVQSVVIKSGESAAKTAIITSGTVNADPLSAAPLSYAMGIPVLLTDGSTLDPAVAAAIQKLGITQLLVLGGPDRVSPAVLAATGIAADHIVRIAGANRYATSADLYTFALQTMGYNDGADTDTYLGNALGGFPDVLSAGPLAGKSDSAILTVGQSGLDAAVQKYLKDHSTANVTALGGTDRVSDAQVTAARALANS